MKTNQSSQMPSYTQRVKVPAGFEYHQLYIRYYSPWGNGDRGPIDDELLYWPEVILPDAFGNVQYIKPEKPSPYILSQYANVMTYLIGGSAEDREVTVAGFFEQVSYVSIAIYNYGKDNTGDIEIISQNNIQGKDFMMNEGDNPFTPGNLSVFSYERPSINRENKCTYPERLCLKGQRECNYRRKDVRNNASVPYQYDFFRTTAEMAREGFYGLFESIAEDGCSPDYLYAVPSEFHDVFILKLKIPTTFIHNDSPDLIYNKYQAQELVIDTLFLNVAVNECYAVNSRQLNDYKDENGYAYVFFMPVEFINRLCEEQNTPLHIPPVYTFGIYTGYVLPLEYWGLPQYDFVNIRHRGSSSEWEGHLTNTQCYLENADQKPILPSDLGEWYPEFYGDTMENFKAGKIGPFSNKVK